jgi:hypothetical protein
MCGYHAVTTARRLTRMVEVSQVYNSKALQLCREKRHCYE